MELVSEFERTGEAVGAELVEDFPTISTQVDGALLKWRPDVAISLAWDLPGWVKVEKIAVNVMSSFVGDRVTPDHAGHAPSGAPVVPGGPLAYPSTLPADDVVAAIREAGIPAFPSYEAGTHVRNAALYSLLHWTSVRGGGCLVGQLHLPPLPGMFGAGGPSMSLEDEARAVRASIGACKRATAGVGT